MHATASTDSAQRAAQGAPRLEILKALGDNTRYAIYLEIARSPRALATAEVADTLGLHVNTVRPHLERMREVGLLEVRTDATGGVGRPQRLYSVSPDAPSLGLEPSPYPRLARMLLQAAASGGLAGEDLAEAGRHQGLLDAEGWPAATSCAEALAGSQTEHGFDPAVAVDDDGAVIAFAHCPYQDLADEHPELVCGLHRGMVEGFVAARVDRCSVTFSSLADREPCRVELVP